MHVFLEMTPPRVTGQMRKVRVVNGRPIFYDPPEIKEARQALCGYLAPGRPDEPLDGPLELRVLWMFPGQRRKDGEWKTTRPDTDNLEKLLKDCMTATGYWKDDAQVCREVIEKRWSNNPSGIYIEVEELE